MEGSINKKSELSFKVCIIGDSGVGKSTLVDRYLTDTFHEDIKKTLGAAIHFKFLDLEEIRIRLQIWDFGGEEKFKFLLPTYARGSSGGIFVFDLTKLKSLHNLRDWLAVFRATCKDAPLLMVGSKLDLHEERVCDKQEALKLMNLYDLVGYIECSSKTGDHVDSAFRNLILNVLSDKGHLDIKLN